MILVYLPYECLSLILTFLVLDVADFLAFSRTCKGAREVVLAFIIENKDLHRRPLVPPRGDNNRYHYDTKAIRAIKEFGINDFVVRASDAPGFCTEWAGIKSWYMFEQAGVQIPERLHLEGLSLVRTAGCSEYLFPEDIEDDSIRGSAFRLCLENLRRLSVDIDDRVDLCRYLAKGAPLIEDLKILPYNSFLATQALNGIDKMTKVRSLAIFLAGGTYDVLGHGSNSLVLDRQCLPPGLTEFYVSTQGHFPCDLLIHNVGEEATRLVSLSLRSVTVASTGDVIGWTSNVKNLTVFDSVLPLGCAPAAEVLDTDVSPLWGRFTRLVNLTIRGNASTSIATLLPWCATNRIPSGVRTIKLDLTSFDDHTAAGGTDPCAFVHMLLGLAPVGLRRLVVQSLPGWTDGREYTYGCLDEDTFAYPPEDAWAPIVTGGHAYPPGYGFIRSKHPNVGITWWIL